MSVMSEYIKMTQEGITQYMKLVFERKFNKDKESFWKNRT